MIIYYIIIYDIIVWTSTNSRILTRRLCRLTSVGDSQSWTRGASPWRCRAQACPKNCNRCGRSWQRSLTGEFRMAKSSGWFDDRQGNSTLETCWTMLNTMEKPSLRVLKLQNVRNWWKVWWCLYVWWNRDEQMRCSMNQSLDSFGDATAYPKLSGWRSRQRHHNAWRLTLKVLAVEMFASHLLMSRHACLLWPKRSVAGMLSRTENWGDNFYDISAMFQKSGGLPNVSNIISSFHFPRIASWISWGTKSGTPFWGYSDDLWRFPRMGYPWVPLNHHFYRMFHV